MAVRAELCRNIQEAKGKRQRGLGELLNIREEDLWGRPYRMVMRKLRTSANLITETMSNEKLRRVIRKLFPNSTSKEEGNEAPKTWGEKEKEEIMDA